MLSPDVAKAIRDRLAGCWSPPPGFEKTALATKISFNLNPDGSLAGKLVVEQAPNSPLMQSRAFIQSAIRAVKKCRGFPELVDAAPYEVWKEIVVDFDPSAIIE